MDQDQCTSLSSLRNIRLLLLQLNGCAPGLVAVLYQLRISRVLN